MTFAPTRKLITAAALCCAFSAAAFAAGPEVKLGPIKGESAERAVDKLGPIKGESAERAAQGIGQELLDVPMGDMIREMSASPKMPLKATAIAGEGEPEIDLSDIDVPADTYGSTRSNRSSGSASGCVMRSGAIDDDCNGVPDASPVSGDVEPEGNLEVTSASAGLKAVSATDYNSSRSNKADTAAAPKLSDEFYRIEGHQGAANPKACIDKKTGESLVCGTTDHLISAPDGGDKAEPAKATDYNSSRSNKSY